MGNKIPIVIIVEGEALIERGECDVFVVDFDRAKRDTLYARDRYSVAMFIDAPDNVIEELREIVNA